MAGHPHLIAYFQDPSLTGCEGLCFFDVDAKEVVIKTSEQTENPFVAAALLRAWSNQGSFPTKGFYYEAAKICKKSTKG